MQFYLLILCLFPVHGELSIRIAEKTAAIRQNPNDLTLYMQRGELHLQHENPDSAILDYEHALKHGIDTTIIHVLAAEAYLAAGKLDLGLEQVQRFIELEPGHLKGLHTRGKLFEASGDLLKARADFELVIDKAKTARPQDYIHLANLHLKIDSINQKPALEILRFGLSRLGNIISLQLKIYELHKKVGDFEAAHDILDEMMKPLSRKERLMVEKAELFLLQKRTSKAAETLVAAENAIASLPPRFQHIGATKKLKQRIKELKNQL